MMISKAHMVSGIQLEGEFFPLALAAVHIRAGIDRRNYPQAFSTLTLSSKRTERRKQKQWFWKR